MKFVVDYAAWEDSDYVVTIRPNIEKVWNDLPVGMCLSEWLTSGLPTLWKIFNNATERTCE